jgi:hypothetical protein
LRRKVTSSGHDDRAGLPSPETVEPNVEPGIVVDYGACPYDDNIGFGPQPMSILPSLLPSNPLRRAVGRRYLAVHCGRQFQCHQWQPGASMMKVPRIEGFYIFGQDA